MATHCITILLNPRKKDVTQLINTTSAAMQNYLQKENSV